MRTGGATYYLFPDHLGGTHITANSSGVQTGKLLYRPWGETRVTSGSTPTTWRFSGQREDATIGLYFYNARFYDPVLGRFIQTDSIVPSPGNPQSLNRYSYTLNNPIRYTDPTGHYAFEDGPEDPFFVNPGNSPTGQPMVIVEPCNLGGCQEATTAELIMVATFPVWVAGGGVAAEAAIFDVAVPAAVSVIGHIAGLLGLGACGDGDCTNEAVALGQRISNEVPTRMARVVPAQYAGSPTLAAPTAQEAFVTAADDIAGITSASGLAERLTLIDKAGRLIPGPFAVIEFDAVVNGLASPVFRNNPGFIGGGLTAGGAREFVIANLPLAELANVVMRFIQ